MISFLSTTTIRAIMAAAMFDEEHADLRRDLMMERSILYVIIKTGVWMARKDAAAARKCFTVPEEPPSVPLLQPLVLKLSRTHSVKKTKKRRQKGKLYQSARKTYLCMLRRRGATAKC